MYSVLLVTNVKLQKHNDETAALTAITLFAPKPKAR